ncbi:MAG: twin-arginine translocase TatA/TatE family subunit [Limisphaerales bacterium]
MNTLFAWAIGGTELIIILVAFLILFGSKKIPEFARGLGQGIKEFKKASREVTDEIQNAPTETPAPPGKSPAASPPASAPTVSQSSNPPKA